ncbi:hypothetical protein [uncultured Gimesia sp.]|mgnify:CR=1 FL=1|uniref:hypothetical protein n=1 Tax=uncultured Gimesia sp. TaxID=1678688 RepID=UPI002608CB0A|nr:hypothetical protein [uncultured Gimesia sp.]
MIFYMALLCLLPMLLFFSLILAETAYPAVDTRIKARLFGSLRRIAHAQKQIPERPERCLLFFSLMCCILAIGIMPLLATELSPSLSNLIETPALVTSQFAPLIFLGLLTILQVAGEVSLALTEQRRNSSASIFLNSYFWLPLLLAWSALTAYLPVDSPHIAKDTGSSMWLGALQPLGYVAFILALIGPYLLINASRLNKVNPVQNWIRELRLLISLLIIIVLLSGHTCFSPVEMESKTAGILRGIIQVILLPVSVGIIFRLKAFFRRRSDLDPERLWKLIMWLSLIALTASFIAFHVLGMSDYLMHVLLNFSLLAIWTGFIAPKGNLKQKNPFPK